MTKEKKKNKKKKLPKLLESCIEDFSEQIKNRGIDYYEKDNVLSCIKNKDDFIATVEGSDDNVYTVNIETDEGKVVYYDCTCPCDFPCKHVYATLLAIDNNEYESPKLKKKIPEKDYDLQEIVKNIPSKKLKQFLLEMKKSVSPNLDFIFGDIPFTGINLPISQFDCSETERDVGFKAKVSFAEGCKKTFEWLKNN